MWNDKIEAWEELKEIDHQLIDLGQQAESIINEHFPEEKSWCEAYKVFRFGQSVSTYDQTFEKLIDNIERARDEGYYDDGAGFDSIDDGEHE